MKGFPWMAFLLLALFAPGVSSAGAEPIAVRYPQGTQHGFLKLSTLDGKILAAGDSIQTMRGSRLTSSLIFHFRDGSIDDDEVVFTQRGSFHLLREHHIQRGPSFAKPMDMSIDVASGTVVTRGPGKDGKEKVAFEHMALTPDLANGMFLVLLTNIRPDAAKTDLPFLVAYNGVRIVHLEIKPAGTVPFRVGGKARPAREFTIHYQLGGLTGMIAPMIGKQPSDCKVLLLEGAAPAFIREEGQLFQDGPVWRIEQVGPVSQ